MRTRAMLSWLSLAALPYLQNLSAGPIVVEIESNKRSYVPGEPLILRTIVSNFSREAFRSGRLAFGWGRKAGFTMYVASGDGDFGDILSLPVKAELGITSYPQYWELFHDRHWLPGPMPAGARATRTDMLIVPKPGQYQLKAALLDRDGSSYASKPISLRVVAAGGKEALISGSAGEDVTVKSGRSIASAHYIGSMWPGTLGEAEFERAAQKVIEEHKDSVFREPTVYAVLRMRQNNQTNTHGLVRGGKELAGRFVREYPRSWLLPDVYRMLFFTAVEEKDYVEAAALREKALEIAPWATVLRDVRECDLEALIEEDRDKKKASTTQVGLLRGRARWTEPSGGSEPRASSRQAGRVS